VTETQTAPDGSRTGHETRAALRRRGVGDGALVSSRAGTDRRVVVLLLDGARHDVFQHLVRAGDLPNIARHILEPGGVIPATTVFPSTTGVAYLPFLTGCYPGTCDVPGIRWLDPGRYRGRWWRDRRHVRSYCGPQGGLLNADLRPGIPTLFDLIPDAVGICTPFSRGLAVGRERAALARKLWGGLAHYTVGYGVLDRAVGRALRQVAATRPSFVFAVFPGVDGMTHFHDPWHPDVLDMYRQFDAIVGTYAAAGGFAGEHLTLLVSDHGLSPVERHTDVSLELEAMGIPTLRHPLTWRRDPRVAVMVSGNASAQVYLLPGIPRSRHFTVAELDAGAVAGLPADLAERLARLPGIAMVVGTDVHGVTVISRGGRATLEETAEGIRYRPMSADALSLGGEACLSDRAWHVATLDAPYPDAPAQLLQLFRSGRAGDLVVIAEPGADCRLDYEVPEHRSGHGSLIADHMRCLVAANVRLAGPVRTTDLFPLVLDFLGHNVPTSIDGLLPAIPATA
jgi:hypothetical protein